MSTEITRPPILYTLFIIPDPLQVPPEEPRPLETIKQEFVLSVPRDLPLEEAQDRYINTNPNRPSGTPSNDGDVDVDMDSDPPTEPGLLDSSPLQVFFPPIQRYGGMLFFNPTHDILSLTNLTAVPFSGFSLSPDAEAGQLQVYFPDSLRQTFRRVKRLAIGWSVDTYSVICAYCYSAASIRNRAQLDSTPCPAWDEHHRFHIKNPDTDTDGEKPRPHKIISNIPNEFFALWPTYFPSLREVFITVDLTSWSQGDNDEFIKLKEGEEPDQLYEYKAMFGVPEGAVGCDVLNDANSQAWEIKAGPGTPANVASELNDRFENLGKTAFLKGEEGGLKPVGSDMIPTCSVLAFIEPRKGGEV
ncbi:hypothetical protein QBC35DRAFT_471096 [Podospora australis]|uniref:Uncharacterized protein n=1 Tax=Podospora australis TaxID=1536484 RepID=A0AAN6X432_9PEZI|nr:hypothetical protein QBC35DRAFT_471096 [Podospora australis]